MVVVLKSSSLLLIVVMATSDVSTQSTQEYDLQNCSIHRVANETHHALHPSNCRVFYNCDVSSGGGSGTETLCPEGTVYDPQTGICDSGGDCHTWNRLANCAVDPIGARNFSGQCCHTYFHYQCSLQTFRFQYCSPGLWFDGTRCTQQRPVSGCIFCDSDETEDRCYYTNMEYSSPCTFRMKGSALEQRCAEGMAMDRGRCDCVRDEAHVCTRSVDCQTKRVFDFIRRTFQVQRSTAHQDPSIRVDPWNSQQHSFEVGPVQNFPLYYLQGQDLAYQPFALMLRFTLNSHRVGGPSAAILTADPSDGFKMEIRVVNRNTVKVTVISRNESLTFTGEVQNTFGDQYTVRVLMDLKDRLLLAQVNGISLRPENDALNLNDTLNRWAIQGIDGVGLLRLGYFYGGILEMSFWRNCKDFMQME